MFIFCTHAITHNLKINLSKQLKEYLHVHIGPAWAKGYEQQNTKIRGNTEI